MWVSCSLRLLATRTTSLSSRAVYAELFDWGRCFNRKLWPCSRACSITTRRTFSLLL